MRSRPAGRAGCASATEHACAKAAVLGSVDGAAAAGCCKPQLRRRSACLQTLSVSKGAPLLQVLCFGLCAAQLVCTVGTASVVVQANAVRYSGGLSNGSFGLGLLNAP